MTIQGEGVQGLTSDPTASDSRGCSQTLKRAQRIQRFDPEVPADAFNKRLGLLNKAVYVSKSRLSTTLLLMLTLFSATAHSRDNERWFTDIEAVTEVPLSLGLRIAIESPKRIRVGFSVGSSPEAYIETVNSVIVAAGAYDAQTAELIASSFDRSIAMRLDLGWRPIADAGFYGQVGYRLISFGGVADGASIVKILNDVTLSEGTSPDFYSYDVASSLHTLDLEFGWIWGLPGGLRLRAGLGFVATLDANISASPINNINLYKERIETILKQTYTDYGFTPTLALGAGFRFE